jgi:hypothetical protein
MDINIIALNNVSNLLVSSASFPAANFKMSTVKFGKKKAATVFLSCFNLCCRSLKKTFYQFNVVGK